jgi:hypothetical protein
MSIVGELATRKGGRVKAKAIATRILERLGRLPSAPAG